jgi:hypothetical protein
MPDPRVFARQISHRLERVFGLFSQHLITTYPIDKVGYMRHMRVSRSLA